MEPQRSRSFDVCSHTTHTHTLPSACISMRHVFRFNNGRDSRYLLEISISTSTKTNDQCFGSQDLHCEDGDSLILLQGKAQFLHFLFAAPTSHAKCQLKSTGNSKPQNWKTWDGWSGIEQMRADRRGSANFIKFQHVFCMILSQPRQAQLHSHATFASVWSSETEHATVNLV